MTGRLIIRNPSEYINIGSPNIHQLKINQHLALNKLSHATKVINYKCTTKKRFIASTKICIFSFYALIPPSNFTF